MKSEKNVKIATLNVRSLRSDFQVEMLGKDLNKYRPTILALQETHLKTIESESIVQ